MYRPTALLPTAAPDRRRLLLTAGALALAAAVPGCAAGPQRNLVRVGRYEKKLAKVKGYHMAYVEAGRGDPIVFLHGNPTSSYLWRNIIPYAAPYGRCIAPDLIGMGDSDKLKDSGPGRYSFAEHRAFLDALLQRLGVEDNVILVVHDWGSGLGLDWANRHRRAIKGVVYMESLLIPPDQRQQVAERSPFFQLFFTEKGINGVLQDNMFVEKILFGGVGQYLTEEDKAVYRKPYLEPGESRRPTLTWPQEVPFGGEPETTWKAITAYSDWLATTDFPKLFVHSVPGAIMRGPILEFARSFKNQAEVTVKGGHFLQEVSPEEIGRALADWLAKVT